MTKQALIEKVKDYRNLHPKFEQIMRQLNIDEEGYLNALNELIGEEPIYVSPLSNTSYLPS